MTEANAYRCVRETGIAVTGRVAMPSISAVAAGMRCTRCRLSAVCVGWCVPKDNNICEPAQCGEQPVAVPAPMAMDQRLSALRVQRVAVDGSWETAKL